MRELVATGFILAPFYIHPLPPSCYKVDMTEEREFDEFEGGVMCIKRPLFTFIKFGNYDVEEIVLDS